MKRYLSYRDFKYVCTYHILRTNDGSIFPNPSNRFDPQTAVCANDKPRVDLHLHGPYWIKEHEDGKIEIELFEKDPECPPYAIPKTYFDLNRHNSTNEDFVIYICEKLLKFDDKTLYQLYASNELIDLTCCNKFNSLQNERNIDRSVKDGICPFLNWRCSESAKAQRPERFLARKFKEFASIKLKVDQMLGYNEEEILNRLLNSNEFKEKYPLWPEQLADRELYVEDGFQYLIKELEKIRKPKIIAKTNELINLNKEDLIKIENELKHIMLERIYSDICEDKSLKPNNAKILYERINSL